MKEEIWKPVLGWTGIFEVSSAGRVRSLVRLRKRGMPGVISQHIGSHGYPGVCLSLNNRREHVLVHRLVVEAFIGEIGDGLFVNHKSGIKKDNSVENLEICTPSQNSYHCTRVLCKNRGSAKGKSSLAETDIPMIMGAVRSGMKHKEVALSYGVSDSAIEHIVNGSTWRHVTGLLRRRRALPAAQP